MSLRNRLAHLEEEVRSHRRDQDLVRVLNAFKLLGAAVRVKLEAAIAEAEARGEAGGEPDEASLPEEFVGSGSSMRARLEAAIAREATRP